MFSPLSANSHCPKSSAPSLPWRPSIPNFFTNTPIPRNARFDPTASRFSLISFDSNPESSNSPPISQVGVESGPVPSTAVAGVSPTAAVAVGMGTAGMGAAVVGATAIAKAASASSTASATTSAASDTSSANVAPPRPTPTPIPPHLLSPIPPSRPSVPAEFQANDSPSTADSGESPDNRATLSASNVFAEASPFAEDVLDEDLAAPIEGEYLDGEDALASATSFGQLEPTALKQSEMGEPLSDSDSEPAAAISMGEVIDDSVLGFSPDSNTPEGLASQSSVTGAAQDSNASSLDLPTSEMSEGGTPKRSGSWLGFFSGFLIGFVIIAALIYIGVRVMQGAGSNDPVPATESTTDTE